MAHRRCLHACIAAPIALLAATPRAAAQQEDGGAAEATSRSGTDAHETHEKKRDMLVVPVPISNPTSGTGLAVGGIVFYNPLHEPRQWVTGGGVLYTDRGGKGIGLFHSMTLGQDRFRVKLIAAYTEGPLTYFGIGDAAGKSGNALDLQNNNLSIQFEGQVRAFPHGYVGVRYKYSHYDSSPPDEIPPGAAPPPTDQMDSALSMIGPILSYDTRDSATFPRRGVFLSGNWLFGLKPLGNSYAHTKLQLAGNAYLPAGRDTVLAVRGTLCGATGQVPFYDFCMLGAGADLRSYEAGRYRDRFAWTAQAEVRHRFTHRIGAVAFAGIGGIAPSLGDVIDKGDALPSMGLGLRYRPFRKNDVNLRLDVAVGLHGPGVYFGVSEAF